MVETEYWVQNAPVFLMLPLMGGAMLLPPPFNLYGLFAAEGGTIGMSAGMRKLAGPLASFRGHYIQFRVTSRQEPSGWTWPSTFTLRWRKHPQSIGYFPNYVFMDGTRGGYLTPFTPERPKTKHPIYNNGGKLKTLLLMHHYPWDIQFKENRGKVSFMGNPAWVPGFSWAVIHERMPGKNFFQGENQGQYKNQLNHVPFIDQDLYHNPRFEVGESSGTRDLQEAQKQRLLIKETQRRVALVAATPRGGQTLICLEDGCGKELGPADKDGNAKCPDDHSWNMKRPKV